MLLTLVRRARMRLICNQLLSQGTVALCAGLAAFILLLLLGTQVLDWRWAALLPLAAVGLGLYRTWQRAPREYRAAQVVDDALSLSDAISTAYYFHDPQRRGTVTDAVREWQHAQAERLCPSVDLTMAVPYRMPRASYAALILFLVAGSLFGLRYGLSHRLDLRAPLTSMLGQSFGEDPVKQAQAPRKKGPKTPEFSTDNAFTVSDLDQKAGELDPASQDALDKSEIPDFDNAKAAPVKGNAKSKNDEGDKLATDDPDGNSEEAAAQGGENGEGQNGKGQPKEGEKSASNQAQPNNSGDNSSLMQKMKEAMQNLLSKMKQQPPQGGNQPSQTAQNKQGQKQQGAGKQQGQQGQKQQNGEQSDSQEGEAGDDAKADASAQSKSAGQSNEQQANKQPGSGIGKQDGAKDLKLAEQMAAMGKISEIIGKRSANVSGEVMIEVQNTNQQLSTRYEAKQATHADSGGEISRDEVPVALQGFVQNYFEQVRAEGAKAEARKAKAKQ